MKKVTTHSLADQARELIRTAIFEGTIKPEEKLTIERLAADLGISRTPVREALKSLEADGIVKLLPHRGAVVQRFDEAEINDRYSVRADLEGYAAEQACRLGGPALAGALEDNCVAMQRLIDAGTAAEDVDTVSSLLKLNAQFHDTILAASGSAIVPRILGTLEMPIVYRMYHWRDPDRQRFSLQCHRNIAAAFRAGQPRRARELVEEHLLETRDFILARS